MNNTAKEPYTRTYNKTKFEDRINGYQFNEQELFEQISIPGEQVL